MRENELKFYSLLYVCSSSHLRGCTWSSYGSVESVNSEYKEQELSKVFIAFWNNFRAFNASTCGVKCLHDCCAMSKMLKVSWIPLLPYWCTIGYGRWGNNFSCYKKLTDQMKSKKTKKYSFNVIQTRVVYLNNHRAKILPWLLKASLLINQASF